MLVVETIAKIRRAYFVQRKSIKAICRELRVSRKTVRKVIRSEETEFSCERNSQPQPKIGPWRDELDRLPGANASRPSRERLTLIRIFEELRELGYDGGYDAVRRYAAAWKRRESEATAAAFVPLRGTRTCVRRFAPGEAYQFDRSHEIVVIDGAATTVKVAHVRLCHSRMMFVRAYRARREADGVRRPRQGVRLLRRGLHARDLRQRPGSAIGPRTMDAKTAVDAIFAGRERACNRRFQQMCGHYLVEPPSIGLEPMAPRWTALRSGFGLGEGAGREPGGRGPAALLRAAAPHEELRGAQRLAGRPLHGLGEGAPSPGGSGANDPGGVRSRAPEPRALSRPLRAGGAS